MFKQKLKKTSKLTTKKALGLLLVAIFAVSAGITPLVRADQFDDQINAIKRENNEKNNNLAQLGSEAASFQDTISKLQAQINSLQAEIDANTAKSNDLQRQITEAEAELAKQRTIIGESIRSMYLEGEISTLEMLASSKDLSDFVDKQQYRNSVQNKIKATMDKITALKAQMRSQKEEVEKLLKDQMNMQSQVAAQRAEQARLLSLNQAQQNELDSQIKTNNSKVAELRRQQIAANARFIGAAGSGPACGGGYPARWCEIPQDSVIDSWGMYNRECVSYAAFRVASSGRHMPYWGGIGNANEWDENAVAYGIPVDGSPRVGDIAISNAGQYGHAMYVESVNGNGTINISQYNAGLDGRFSYRDNLSPSGLRFIHF